MKTNEAMQLLGCANPSELARALKITPSAVSQWGGVLPPLQVYRVREIASERQKAEKQAA